VRALARLCLQRYGYTVIEAGNGPEALAAWQRSEGKIDLLLTDVVMPGGMSGRELAEELWRQSPGLKVIFSSGYSTDLSEQADLGPHASFLPKPYEIEVLARTVRDFLDGKPTAW
jgi:CheY-like chemotaxis protein